MILKVLADTREIHDHLNVVLLQVLRRPNPGQHEQFRRVYSTRAYDHFTLGADDFELSVLQNFDTNCSVPFNEKADSAAFGPDLQVRTLTCRTEICDRSAASTPIPGID